MVFFTRLQALTVTELSVNSAKTIADFGRAASQTFFNEAFRLVEDVA